LYEVKNTNEDVTVQEIKSWRVGKCILKLDAPDSTPIFLNIGEKELKAA